MTEQKYDSMTFRSPQTQIEWKAKIPRDGNHILFMGQKLASTTDFVNRVYLLERTIIKGYVRTWFGKHDKEECVSDIQFLEDIYQQVFCKDDPIIRPLRFPSYSSNIQEE